MKEHFQMSITIKSVTTDYNFDLAYYGINPRYHITFKKKPNASKNEVVIVNRDEEGQWKIMDLNLREEVLGLEAEFNKAIRKNNSHATEMGHWN